ncbi:MAG: hypothetical protein PUI48_02150 [Oscillospiraceae bacterium]|nr:hypothetical protein [Oscillospiraceae bacterium]MDY6209108.1 hypothetical protein [Oscillospiraceae bacterium]
MSINFHLPDFCGNYKMNLAFADAIKERPELFYDGVKIASSYGCFPPAAWNGGRAAVGAVRRDFINFIIKEYNSRGIPIRYTFTNPLVTEKHLSDPFCNMITEAAANGLNEIIVNVPVLEEYIRKKFPQYPLISSTVKQIEDREQLLCELEKDYKLVVLDYNWNNRFDELEALPRKDKIELLVNSYCTPHCKRRRKHYEFLGEMQFELNRQVFGSERDMMKPIPDRQFPCPNTDLNFYDTLAFETHISPENIYEKYVPMGFENFKIEGRLMHPVNILESYLYYLVKPEHRDRLRVDMLRALLGNKR